MNNYSYKKQGSNIRDFSRLFTSDAPTATGTAATLTVAKAATSATAEALRDLEHSILLLQ